MWIMTIISQRKDKLPLKKDSGYGWSHVTHFQNLETASYLWNDKARHFKFGV